MDCIARIAKAAGLLCLGVALTACTLDFSVPAQAVTELSVYQSDPQIFKLVVPADDPVVVTVNAWVAAHSDGWRYAFITRPSRIYLSGKNFSVNIQEHEVSVKYCRGMFNCHFYVKANEDLFPLIQNTATLKALSRKK